MITDGRYQDKRLRGSGGYVLAKITEEEQKKGNLGGPELFLAGLGRLDENRLLKHYCNKCEEQFEGSPSIVYDSPNEDLGEGVFLEEKGEYKCKKCNSTIAQYRKFRSPQKEMLDQAEIEPPEENKGSSMEQEKLPKARERPAAGSTPEVYSALINEEFVPIQSVIEMPAYDTDALLIGNIKEVGLRRQKEGKVEVSIVVQDQRKGKTKSCEILWSNISKIGDIVLINENHPNVEAATHVKSERPKCGRCGYTNENGAKYCEECGSAL